MNELVRKRLEYTIAMLDEHIKVTTSAGLDVATLCLDMARLELRSQLKAVRPANINALVEAIEASMPSEQRNDVKRASTPTRPRSGAEAPKKRRAAKGN